MKHFYRWLYTSTDGTTWNRTNAAGLPTSLNIQAPVKKIGGIWYLSTYGAGLYTSTDGINWTQSATAKGIPTDTQIWTTPILDNGVYYLSTVGKGLYTSTNGTNWNRTNATGINTSARAYVEPVKIAILDI